MREPPGGFVENLLVVPIREFRSEMAEEHSPGAGEHVAGYPQTLGACFLADDFGHLVVDYFEGAESYRLAGWH
jgi:hypothetical protein